MERYMNECLVDVKDSNNHMGSSHWFVQLDETEGYERIKGYSILPNDIYTIWEVVMKSFWEMSS